MTYGAIAQFLEGNGHRAAARPSTKQIGFRPFCASHMSLVDLSHGPKMRSTEWTRGAFVFSPWLWLNLERALLHLQICLLKASSSMIRDVSPGFLSISKQPGASDWRWTPVWARLRLHGPN